MNSTRYLLDPAPLDGVASALDEVALPADGEGPLSGLGRAHRDAQQIGHLAPAILAPAARHALGFGVAQASQMFVVLAYHDTLPMGCCT